MFANFSPQIFLTIFLVKSKLSTAKKSKTTTFSRVFHPQKIYNFLRKLLNFWTKNEDFEQCVIHTGGPNKFWFLKAKIFLISQIRESLFTFQLNTFKTGRTFFNLTNFLVRKMLKNSSKFVYFLANTGRISFNLTNFSTKKFQNFANLNFPFTKLVGTPGIMNEYTFCETFT